MTADRSSAGFFEAKYRANADPWNFASSEYELGRYDATVHALDSRYYKRCFEPGCAVGVLTEKLAEFCGEVEAIDFSETAVKQAQARCAALPNVRIHCESLTDRLPVTGFDLLLLSEVGYYFTPAEWHDISEELTGPMPRGGTLLAVHWLGTSPDHRMSGDQVHAILESLPGLQLEHAERHEAFRLQRWVRV